MNLTTPQPTPSRATEGGGLRRLDASMGVPKSIAFYITTHQQQKDHDDKKRFRRDFAHSGHYESAALTASTETGTTGQKTNQDQIGSTDGQAVVKLRTTGDCEGDEKRLDNVFCRCAATGVIAAPAVGKATIENGVTTLDRAELTHNAGALDPDVTALLKTLEPMPSRASKEKRLRTMGASRRVPKTISFGKHSNGSMRLSELLDSDVNDDLFGCWSAMRSMSLILLSSDNTTHREQSPTQAGHQKDHEGKRCSRCDVAHSNLHESAALAASVETEATGQKISQDRAGSTHGQIVVKSCTAGDCEGDEKRLDDVCYRHAASSVGATPAIDKTTTKNGVTNLDRAEQTTKNSCASLDWAEQTQSAGTLDPEMTTMVLTLNSAQNQPDPKHQGAQRFVASCAQQHSRTAAAASRNEGVADVKDGVVRVDNEKRMLVEESAGPKLGSSRRKQEFVAWRRGTNDDDVKSERMDAFAPAPSRSRTQQLGKGKGPRITKPTPLLKRSWARSYRRLSDASKRRTEERSCFASNCSYVTRRKNETIVRGHLALPMISNKRKLYKEIDDEDRDDRRLLTKNAYKSLLLDEAEEVGKKCQSNRKGRNGSKRVQRHNPRRTVSAMWKVDSANSDLGDGPTHRGVSCVGTAGSAVTAKNCRSGENSEESFKSDVAIDASDRAIYVLRRRSPGGRVPSSASYYAVSMLRSAFGVGRRARCHSRDNAGTNASTSTVSSLASSSDSGSCGGDDDDDNDKGLRRIASAHARTFFGGEHMALWRRGGEKEPEVKCASVHARMCHDGDGEPKKRNDKGAKHTNACELPLWSRIVRELEKEQRREGRAETKKAEKAKSASAHARLCLRKQMTEKSQGTKGRGESYLSFRAPRTSLRFHGEARRDGGLTGTSASAHVRLYLGESTRKKQQELKEEKRSISAHVRLYIHASEQSAEAEERTSSSARPRSFRRGKPKKDEGGWMSASFRLSLGESIDEKE